MKKSILTSTLVLVFCFAAFADDGNTPVGTKNCPSGQNCLVNPNPMTETKDDSTILIVIKRLIATLF